MENMTQYVRDSENEMPVGNFLEDVPAKPFPEFHDPLLVA
jgi:hypothetical protein